jgi:undecaprenyl-diphosphatase
VFTWILVPPVRRLPAAIGAAVGAGLLMGYARVALGVHWPTDALGGLLLGSGWFAATTLMATRPSARSSTSAARSDETRSPHDDV